MSMQKKTSMMLISVFFAALVFSGCNTVDIIKAEVMLTQEKYSNAIPILEKYVEQNPDSVQATSRLGFAYLKTGRIDESIATLEKTIAIQPDEPHAILNLGLAYLNKGQYNKAITVWQEFKDNTQPLVEAEIKRQISLIQIVESQKAAKMAIANEKKMQAAKLEEATLAVCYYKDLSKNNELQGFQKGLAAMVITEFSKIHSLKVVERVRMQALFQEMKLGQTGIVDPKTAPRIGQLVGAENLVVGTLSGEIQVATTLASSSTGKVKGTTAATIKKESFFEIPKGIVLDTTKIIGIDLTPEETTAIGTPLTRNYAAVVHYGMALDAMDAGHWEKAKDLYAMALMEDPRFDLAKRGLEGCPGGSSPTPGVLATMTTSQIASMVESAIDEAISGQNAADEEAEETGAGGGGGGGGH